MRKPRSKSQPDPSALSRDEWDFTGIPQEELWIAEIYEYSREVKAIQDAFNNWLNSEGRILVGSVRHHGGEYEDTYKYLGRSNRELLQEFDLPAVCPGDDRFDVSPEILLKDGIDDLDPFALSDLAPILGGWPAPFKVMRSSKPGKRGLSQLRKPKPLLDPVRLARRSDLINLKPNRKLLHVVVDIRANKTDIQKKFGDLCRNIFNDPKSVTKWKPGRKKNTTPPRSKL